VRITKDTPVKSFATIHSIIEPPNLLEVQKKSYDGFLQKDVPPRKRKNQGLQAVFNTTFPIYDFNEDSYLEFVSYSIGAPKYDREECKERGMTYSVPFRAVIRLAVRERNPESGALTVKDIRQEELYLGEFPLMTEEGTFIINGAERVIVSQLHRSPGVIYKEKIHTSGKRLYEASIIPYRGSWLEFTTDINGLIFFSIDRKRKLLVTILLRALGGYETDEQIWSLFYPRRRLHLSRITEGNPKLFLASAIKETETGTILVDVGTELSAGVVEALERLGLKEAEAFEVGDGEGDMMIARTIAKDEIKSPEDALNKIYTTLRPGDLANLETARTTLNNLFFNERRYDLATVGRLKINEKFGLSVPLSTTILAKEDIVATIKGLIEQENTSGSVDDVDHLGNRRVRSVGELLFNKFQVGLARMERVIRERMSILEIDECMPRDLINTKPLSATIKEFFGSSQLSQFLDQVNPLAELTHKRRLSALGPGGLSRERAGFEVRDVHYTHYGRLCPIETPEGPNIGLISSLATYARVNEYGLIETPYRKVDAGKVSKHIEYLTADTEDRFNIAQANAKVSPDGKLASDRVAARYKGEFPQLAPSDIDYIDVSPVQLVSVSTSLIPFLEHDDANRALMGSNMQRQAVPLVDCELPLIGTGMEMRVAHDSGVMVIARHDGEVIDVDASRIIVRQEEKSDQLLEGLTDAMNKDIYHLKKFKRTNQDTCFNQVPLVSKGERVKKGQVLADGPATQYGELSLGQNILVAFMPWMGYNFEDAILVSERLLKSDRFVSIHIEEFELECRDTKLGPEEITRDIPNVSSDAIRNLDRDGIIRTGAFVKAGDILIGKVTPKGETELLPEEKLLKAIFGEKAGEVRDASLKAPPGMEGWVVDVCVYTRKESTTVKERLSDAQVIKDIEEEREKSAQALKNARDHCLEKLLVGKSLEKAITHHQTGEVVHKKGEKITERTFRNKLLLSIIEDNLVFEPNVESKIETIMLTYRNALNSLSAQAEKRIDAFRKGDELAPSVLKLVKVYVARKRRLAVGDKMAGRHGNKGVVAKILPEEDMPFLFDGTPVDMVLNPLGVPSRMNVGQILETHLGWAAEKGGYRVMSPVFDGVPEETIKKSLAEQTLPTTGKTTLYDGRTGDKFSDEVTVGYIYMMKLHHLADDKIHARSVGPYSLVTQQPLGGKGQLGGQRFGEMEVWALEAYGAAYTLQEMLTVKSDDVIGRARMYEAIVKGEPAPQPGTPESFNVLIRELRSLCLDIEPQNGVNFDGQVVTPKKDKPERK